MKNWPPSCSVVFYECGDLSKAQLYVFSSHQEGQHSVTVPSPEQFVLNAYSREPYLKIDWTWDDLNNALDPTESSCTLPR